MRNGPPVEHVPAPARSVRAPEALLNSSVSGIRQPCSDRSEVSVLTSVVNGSHNELPDDLESGIGTSGLPLASTYVGNAGRRRHNGGTIMFDPQHIFIDEHSFEHSSTSLSNPMPWSPLDQMIAHLVTCLEAAPGTGHDLRIVGAFLPLIPRRLINGNMALGHAVELLLSAWTNSRRGLPSHTWLDLRTYNRALRSLKTALDDANVEQLTNTLTALCILQKIEVSTVAPRVVAAWHREHNVETDPSRLCRSYTTLRGAQTRKIMQPGSSPSPLRVAQRSPWWRWLSTPRLRVFSIWCV